LVLDAEVTLLEDTGATGTELVADAEVTREDEVPGATGKDEETESDETDDEERADEEEEVETGAAGVDELDAEEVVLIADDDELDEDETDAVESDTTGVADGEEETALVQPP
ncbi:hypothetical protein LTR04_002090, partial [Oleoguttula sp. CCFEE 6159]